MSGCAGPGVGGYGRDSRRGNLHKAISATTDSLLSAPKASSALFPFLECPPTPVSKLHLSAVGKSADTTLQGYSRLIACYVRSGSVLQRMDPLSKCLHADA